MKYIFFAFAMILYGNGFGQKVIFRDDFSGNTNNWPVQTSGPDQFQLVNGKYILEGSTDSTRLATIPVKLDASKDYTISVSATHLDGATDYEYGLYIGNKDGQNSCTFAISSIGFYKFYGYVNGVYTQFYDWTYYPVLKKGNGVKNIMTLKKEKGDWIMYLNGKWVAAVPVQFSFADLQIGVTRSNKQKVAFDDLTITELN